MVEMPEHGHEPVMMVEVLEHLALRPGMVVMDCTVGRGGHSAKMIESISPGGTLIALDVDPENLKYARQRLEAMNVPGVQIRMFHANFGEAADVLHELQIAGVDALLADFGVSSNQILETRHGLSFSADSKLDMRLDPRIKLKASDLLAQWDEKQIADALYEYAQERFSFRIARKIVQTRATEPIQTTGQLARLVRSVVPQKWGQIDPATRTFQALRMAVNAEIDVLQDLLDNVPKMMKPQGRAAFISFHSGEDRLVKLATREWESQELCEVLTKKPLEPGDVEVHRNPRSRSAKLRSVLWK